jgi:rubrerythrin
MRTVASHSITIANLQAAFQGESNASARYAEFAKKADEDGYLAIASLFRAASKAEEFHARNHAEVLRLMNAEPKAFIEQTDVKSTAENLQTAIEGEIYERDVMYPQFLEDAKKNGETDAMRTFLYALKTEAEHANLFDEAFREMDSMRDPKTWYVCQVCGWTVAKLNFLKCLVCGHSKEDYVAIS